MGVSIFWSKTIPTEHFITPGGRSAMHQVLLDQGLYGTLDASDIPALLQFARCGTEDMKPHPEMRRFFHILVRAIRRHGRIILGFGY